MGIPQVPVAARPAAAPQTMVLRFTLDVPGTRTFHCPSGRNYRFDNGAARQQRLHAADAQYLAQRHPQAFRIEGV